MRLTDHQIKVIREAFKKHFLESDHLWLFGSRVDDNKRGGDIDLYIETAYEDVTIVAKKEISFLVDMKLNMGDQKIDIVLNVLRLKLDLPIYKEARDTGVLIK